LIKSDYLELLVHNVASKTILIYNLSLESSNGQKAYKNGWWIFLVWLDAFLVLDLSVWVEISYEWYSPVEIVVWISTLTQERLGWGGDNRDVCVFSVCVSDEDTCRGKGMGNDDDMGVEGSTWLAGKVGDTDWTDGDGVGESFASLVGGEG